MFLVPGPVINSGDGAGRGGSASSRLDAMPNTRAVKHFQHKWRKAVRLYSLQYTASTSWSSRCHNKRGMPWLGSGARLGARTAALLVLFAASFCFGGSKAHFYAGVVQYRVVDIPPNENLLEVTVLESFAERQELPHAVQRSDTGHPVFQTDITNPAGYGWDAAGYRYNNFRTTKYIPVPSGPVEIYVEGCCRPLNSSGVEGYENSFPNSTGLVRYATMYIPGVRASIVAQAPSVILTAKATDPGDYAFTDIPIPAISSSGTAINCSVRTDLAYTAPGELVATTEPGGCRLGWRNAQHPWGSRVSAWLRISEPSTGHYTDMTLTLMSADNARAPALEEAVVLNTGVILPQTGGILQMTRWNQVEAFSSHIARSTSDGGRSSASTAPTKSSNKVSIDASNSADSSVSDDASSLKINIDGPSELMAAGSPDSNGTATPLPTYEELLALGSSKDSGVGREVLKVGSQAWYRWVVVDIEPPRVSGAVFMSNTSISLGDPITASDDGDLSHLRYLIVQLNMSKPVRPFDLAASLLLTGGAHLISADCFNSTDAAAAVAATAAVTAAVVEPGSPPTAVLPPRQPASSVPGLGALVKSAAFSGQQVVRSCVAVLYAIGDDEPTIVLPARAVIDSNGIPSEK
ncbi:hypothetical protein PLESTM_000103400 [Pleodorina starrii]|nr:hypothetical protein PLESTM_000103400 [Pleodorina starrii]